jgi:hypothetical protein
LVRQACRCPRSRARDESARRTSSSSHSHLGGLSPEQFEAAQKPR